MQGKLSREALEASLVSRSIWEPLLQDGETVLDSQESTLLNRAAGPRLSSKRVTTEQAAMPNHQTAASEVLDQIIEMLSRQLEEGQQARLEVLSLRKAVTGTKIRFEEQISYRQTKFKELTGRVKRIEDQPTLLQPTPQSSQASVGFHPSTSTWNWHLVTPPQIERKTVAKPIMHDAHPYDEFVQSAGSSNSLLSTHSSRPISVVIPDPMQSTNADVLQSHNSMMTAHDQEALDDNQDELLLRFIDDMQGSLEEVIQSAMAAHDQERLDDVCDEQNNRCNNDGEECSGPLQSEIPEYFDSVGSSTERRTQEDQEDPLNL